MYPKITIIIPAYKEEDVILDTLNHLVNEVKYPRKEIIVGIDTTDDKTYKITREFQAKNKKKNIIIDFSHRRRGILKVTNSMVSKSSGSIIVRLDSEGRFLNSKKALFNLAKHFNSKEIGAVTFKVVFPLSFYKNQNLQFIGEISSAKLVTDWRDDNLQSPVSSIPSNYVLGCHAFKKNLFEKFNKNDSICDEIEITNKIIKKGYKVKLVNDIYYYTIAPSTSGYFTFLQKRRSAFGLFHMSKNWKISLPRYYFSLGLYFLRNLKKYRLVEITSIIYLLILFTIAHLDAFLKHKINFKKEIWIRYPRKLVYE